MPLELVYDDSAEAALDGLFDVDRELYDRVYDLLDTMADDPRNPAARGRLHSLRDRDGEPILGTAVRSASGEVAVLWYVLADDDGEFIRVAYIGGNDQLRL